MNSFATNKCVFNLVVISVGLCSTFFWVSIPLILLAMIDRVIAQNSPDSLYFFGVTLLILTIFASASEIGLASLTAYFIRSRLVSRNIFLQLSATKALVFLVIMAFYSLLLAGASTVLTAIACGAYYLTKKSRVGSEPSSHHLPLSFRLPLTLIVLFILWYGLYLVLDGSLTFGQWRAMGIFNLQFVASLLSLMADAIGNGENMEQLRKLNPPLE